jgi:hypothetical protein
VAWYRGQDEPPAVPRLDEMSLRRAAVSVAAVLVAACADPDPNRIRVTVYHAGEPAAGATVWFSDPATGALLAEGKTSAKGRFSASAPGGASVTAAVEDPDPDSPAWTLHSILGAQPGDDLWVGDRRSRSPSGLGTLGVRLPGAWSGAAIYRASIGCTTGEVSDPQALVALPLTSACVNASGNAVARASALDGSLAGPLAFTPAIEVPAPAAGETVTVELEPWRTDGGELALGLANVDPAPDVAHLEVRVFYAGMRFDVWEGEVDPSGGAPTVVRYQPDVALQVSWRGSVVHGSLEEDLQVQSIARSARPPLPSAAAVDFAEALPRVSSVDGAIGERGSPDVSWITAEDPAGADGVIVRAKWTNLNRTRVRWTTVAPVTAATSVGFPAVPDSLASMRGVPAFPVEATATLLDLEGATGYEEVRIGGALEVLYPPPLHPGRDHRLSASGRPF